MLEEYQSNSEELTLYRIWYFRTKLIFQSYEKNRDSQSMLNKKLMRLTLGKPSIACSNFIKMSQSRSDEP